MRTKTHKSGMREYVPDEKDLRMKEGEDLVGAVAELARIVRILDRRVLALEPDMTKHRQLVRGENIPAELIIEKKEAKIKRRVAQIAARISVIASITVAMSIGIQNGAGAATELPVTGLHDYAYTEPFRYWSSDIGYISDRLIEYLETKAEVEAARGSEADLATRLAASLNADGTVKEGAVAAFISQWQLEEAAPSYIDDSDFSLDGDLTLVYVAGRRILMHGSAGYVYATVTGGAYESPATVVTVSGGAVPGDVDEIRYSIIAESRVLPEYTTQLVGTDAAFSGDASVAGTATVGTAVMAAGRMPTGAGAGKVLGGDADGNFVWTGLGALAIDPDQVESTHVADADGTSGQNTSTGTGIKTGHMQDSAVTLPKMGSDVKSIAGTAYALIPKGGIIMWAGTFGGADNKYPMIGGAPNAAWHICDGTDGTPDLRDRFVVGAGSTYATGATGGAATVPHTHSDGTYTVAPHKHTLSSHTHTVAVSGTTGNPNNVVSVQGYVGSGTKYSVATNIHTHSFADASSTTSVPSQTYTSDTAPDVSGTSGAASNESNLPPYYALSFMQRI